MNFVERFTPKGDGSGLDCLIVVTDPEVFTELVTLDKHWVYRPGETVQPTDRTPGVGLVVTETQWSHRILAGRLRVDVVRAGRRREAPGRATVQPSNRKSVSAKLSIVMTTDSVAWGKAS